MADYYQGVVAEYLRSDRAVFVNPEFCLQLEPGKTPKKGSFWYCDLLAVSLREREVYLCEVTYSSTAAALIKRLTAWNMNWPEVRNALIRDCSIDESWKVSPWVFLPSHVESTYRRKLGALRPFKKDGMPEPKFTVLEDVVPWKIDWASPDA